MRTECHGETDKRSPVVCWVVCSSVRIDLILELGIGRKRGKLSR